MYSVLAARSCWPFIWYGYCRQKNKIASNGQSNLHPAISHVHARRTCMCVWRAVALPQPLQLRCVYNYANVALNEIDPKSFGVNVGRYTSDKLSVADLKPSNRNRCHVCNGNILNWPVTILIKPHKRGRADGCVVYACRMVTKRGWVATLENEKRIQWQIFGALETQFQKDNELFRSSICRSRNQMNVLRHIAYIRCTVQCIVHCHSINYYKSSLYINKVSSFMIIQKFNVQFIVVCTFDQKLWLIFPAAVAADTQIVSAPGRGSSGTRFESWHGKWRICL